MSQSPRQLPRLPPEILQEIFQETLGKFIRPVVDKPPLLLTSVCSEWRNVAISFPKLWSSVWISTLGNKPALPLLTLWLERSQSCPLSFQVTERDSFMTRPSRLRDVLDLYTPHVARWQSIVFILYHLPLEPFQRIMDQGTPLLEDVYLHWTGESQQPVLNAMSRLFESAPHLHRFNTSSDRLTVPWSQLTDICIHSISIGRCLEILQQAQSLVDCRFTCLPTTDSSNFTTTTTLIRLAHLRTLDLTYEVENLLNPLVLPALRVLHLSDVKSFKPLLQLLLRSKCPLERLALRVSPPHDEYFLQCLMQVSLTLTTLYLGRTTDPANPGLRLLPRFCAGTTGETLCPKLETLFINYGFADESLADLFLSRCQHGISQLKAVQCLFSVPRCVSLVKRLQEMDSMIEGSVVINFSDGFTWTSRNRKPMPEYWP
jgi:hypothetical protein